MNPSAPILSARNLRHEFIAFAIQAGVLRFGKFVTKAGRISPYFFNAGLFNDGATLGRLAEFYAKTIQQAGLDFDMLFGPAYKGITLAAATAIALAQAGQNMPFAYNRKEIKDHGEGGALIGAPLQGRIVIVDDVISAGTSIREAVKLIREYQAVPRAVLIALDRMEQGTNTQQGEKTEPLSAVQEVENEFGIPVISIANLNDLLDYLALQQDPVLQHYQEAVLNYRKRYGIDLT